eukprot:1151628-Pelagomonas_calceolata.AAC.5
MPLAVAITELRVAAAVVAGKSPGQKVIITSVCYNGVSIVAVLVAGTAQGHENSAFKCSV